MRISLLLTSVTAAACEKQRQYKGENEHPARLVAHQLYLTALYIANMKPKGDERGTGSKNLKLPSQHVPARHRGCIIYRRFCP